MSIDQVDIVEDIGESLEETMTELKENYIAEYIGEEEYVERETYLFVFKQYERIQRVF